MSIFNDANKQLDSILAKKKAQSFEQDRSTLLKSVGNDMAHMLEPVMERTMQKVIDRQSINVAAPIVNVPATKVTVNPPNVYVPEPKVTVNVPKTVIPDFPRIPKLEWPSGDMPIKGWVQLMGVNLENPLPVQLRDEHGAPLKLFDNLTQVVNNQAGGFKRVTIDKILDSNGTPYSSTNPIPVTITSGGTATTGSNIVDSSGIAYSGSNPIPVTITSGATATSGSALVDSSGIAYSGSNPVPITGTVTVGTITGITNSTAVTLLNGEGVARDTWGVTGTVAVSGVTNTVAVSLVDSSGIQYSGSNPILVNVSSSNASANTCYQVNGDGLYRDTFPIQGTITGITNSTAVSLIGSDGLAFGTTKPVPVTMVTGVSASVIANISDSSGVGYSGSNPIPVTFVTGVSATVAAASIDSSGIQYSGSNPMPVYTVAISGAGNSTIAVGSVVSGAPDDGSAPIKNGGIARQANPTAVSAGQTVSATYDDLGRQVMKTLQVRDLVSTAYATFTNGTETTLLAATAGVYNDLIWILAANASTVSVGCNVRAVTGGGVLMHLEVPANSTTGIVTPAVPLFGASTDASGNNWTVQMDDVTGTTLHVSALFSKEV